MAHIERKNFGITPDNLEQNYKQLVMSSDKLEFTITQDIKNTSGALVARSGRNIDKSVCTRLLQHKLMRPLDEYLHFTNQVSEDTLVEDVINKNNVLGDTNLDFDSVVSSINSIVRSLQYDKTIMNKLTVYKYDRSDTFEHSLSVALLSTEIGKALNLSLHQLAELFSVCLFHDIGEMLIDEGIYHKQELESKDFDVIATHPVLSYMLLRESKTVFSNQVLSAVLNHHERLDQSGYPRNVPAKNINHFARIVALVDTYDAMRRRGRSSIDALWAIKIQGHCRSISGETITPAFDPELIEVLQSLLDSNADHVNVQNDISFREQKTQLQLLLTKLNSINDDVVQLWETMASCLGSESFFNGTKQLQQAQLQLHRVKNLILASSGIVGSDFDSLFRDQDDIVDIQKDLYRMAPELKRQLFRIKGMLSDLEGRTQDEQLVSLISLNRSAYKKCNELYRAMVVSSSVH